MEYYFPMVPITRPAAAVRSVSPVRPPGYGHVISAPPGYADITRPDRAFTLEPAPSLRLSDIESQTSRHNSEILPPYDAEVAAPQYGRLGRWLRQNGHFALCGLVLSTAISGIMICVYQGLKHKSNA